MAKYKLCISFIICKCMLASPGIGTGNGTGDGPDGRVSGIRHQASGVRCRVSGNADSEKWDHAVTESGPPMFHFPS